MRNGRVKMFPGIGSVVRVGRRQYQVNQLDTTNGGMRTLGVFETRSAAEGKLRAVQEAISVMLRLEREQQVSSAKAETTWPFKLHANYGVKVAHPASVVTMSSV